MSVKGSQGAGRNRGAEGADVPRQAYSIPEFCSAHRISQSMYYKLRAADLGPREMRALRKVMISVEAAAEWRRERERVIANSDAGQDV